MIRRLFHFWRGLSTNWIGTIGVVLTTSSFLLFLFLEFLRIIGVLKNAYIGLITYLTLPALFVLGLLLIPFGWWRYLRKTNKSTQELLKERFEEDFVRPRTTGSKLVGMIAWLTLVNLIFLGAGGARMLNFMEQPSFCGTACHSVMSPEWTTYQVSPHARVKCVDCHVGEGLGSEVDAKLNGLWQMISVTFNLYERPIPTPVHNLRPARETCEKCHWPEVFYGNRIKAIEHYGLDRDSSRRYSTLALKVGSGTGKNRGEIHWHVAEQNQVRYLPADSKRMSMGRLEVRQPDGRFKTYENRALTQGEQEFLRSQNLQTRVLDCVDCHNRATHIYEDPEDAVNRRLSQGTIDSGLPYVKRQALASLTGNYPKGEAATYIERDFFGFYQKQFPEILSTQKDRLEQSVQALKDAHAKNIHERMQVGWNVYPNHIGHRHGPGCRRCHTPDMKDERGVEVPNNCTLCHSILAYESNTPFHNLLPPDINDPECELQFSLGQEFVGAEALQTNPCKPVVGENQPEQP